MTDETDRTLIELAAKAAGYTDQHNGDFVDHANLESDLGINIEWGDGWVSAWRGNRKKTQKHDGTRPGRRSARRLASLMLAAAIGMAMADRIGVTR